jgi:hypothetical protein
MSPCAYGAVDQIEFSEQPLIQAIAHSSIECTVTEILRIDFIKSSPALKPLRKRADWTLLLKDPAAHLRSHRGVG